MTRYKIIVSPTSGRGNDYCFGVKVPLGLEEACQVLADDQRQIIDVGI